MRAICRVPKPKTGRARDSYRKKRATHRTLIRKRGGIGFRLTVAVSLLVSSNGIVFGQTTPIDHTDTSCANETDARHRSSFSALG